MTLYDALGRYHDDVAVLVYLARCDNDYAPNKIAAIVDYVVTTQTNRIIDRDDIARYVSKLNPDRLSCWDELDRLAKRPHCDIENFNRALKRVLDVNGCISEEEFSFLIELQNSFNAHGKIVAANGSKDCLPSPHVHV